MVIDLLLLLWIREGFALVVAVAWLGVVVAVRGGCVL